jgi:four helix bundle protein
MHFAELRVYHLSEQLADTVWDCVEAWRPLAKDTVGKQLVRAADSIGANIAEGSSRGSYKDNKRFVRIARGSFHEVQHWLRRAYCRKLLVEDKIAALKTLMDDLGPMRNAYLKSIGTKRAKRQTPRPTTNDQ